MELYHLKTFVTVAEEQHLTRAAERLFSSQPAISAHIKALEEELRLTLFERTPGHAAHPRASNCSSARATLAAAGDFVLHARQMQGELMGSVRIGLNSDAAFLRLIELQAGLRAHHPRLEIEFLAGASGTNLPALRVGKLDAAFISGECDDPLLESRVLCEEELVVAAPEACASASPPATSPRWPAFLGLYLARLRPFPVMRSLFEAHCCEPSKTLLANQEDALRAMVGAGVGLASCAARTSSRPARRPRSTPCRWRCPRSACVSPICASVPMTRWCAHWWRNCLTCGRWRRGPAAGGLKAPL